MFDGTSLIISQPVGRRGNDPVEMKRKQCNCRNSRCLKLYCECFASGQYCFGCNCQGCHNNPENDEKRKRAIESTLERNPSAFRPKINHNAAETDLGRHTKGCHCKKSGCLKKYCECFQAGIMCTAACKCSECKNIAGNEERAALTLGGRVPTPNAKKPRRAEPLAASVSGAETCAMAHAAAYAPGTASKTVLSSIAESPVQRARAAISQRITPEFASEVCTQMLQGSALSATAGGNGTARQASEQEQGLSPRQESEVLDALQRALNQVLSHATAQAKRPRQPHANVR
uniref:CRC domain-containing protein n=1 Tax=Chrysotila carterae TaxID=13221 RepID=A0A7S4C148_CHRCT|mmetsp:Transcript_37493/g.78882  ORF Transcript_37493/g.78882 Transcript_37493/m.78882 type:complete len:288 (-) Transcript_37493:201-1064(-)